MLKKTNDTEQGQSLGLVKKENNSQSNGKEQLVEYFQINETPFTVARNDKEWFVLMGKYKLTNDLKTKHNAIKNARSMTWDRIVQVMFIIANDAKEQVLTANDIKQTTNGQTK